MTKKHKQATGTADITKIFMETDVIELKEKTRKECYAFSVSNVTKCWLGRFYPLPDVLSKVFFSFLNRHYLDLDQPPPVHFFGIASYLSK